MLDFWQQGAGVEDNGTEEEVLAAVSVAARGIRFIATEERGPDRPGQAPSRCPRLLVVLMAAIAIRRLMKMLRSTVHHAIAAHCGQTIRFLGSMTVHASVG